MIRDELKRGNKRLHIVAPPGSGKTVLGLYVWACEIKRPAVVLSPTSAIQSQWLARTDLFDVPGLPGSVSDDAGRPALLTSLTYQSLTLPRRRDDDLDAQARELWIAKLCEEGHADDPAEARVWIDDLLTRNRAYHDRRLATYRKGVIEGMTRGDDASDALHVSSREAIARLRAHEVGLIILDECHHLMGHWGRVLSDAQELLDRPVILALTATPPIGEGRDDRDMARYREFLGEVDFEVPIPAVVKEGHLAPYQDLVQFVRPEDAELSFIAGADRQVRELVEELVAGRDGETERRRDGVDDGDAGGGGRTPLLLDWLEVVLRDRVLPTGAVKDWRSFVRRDAALADAGRLFLLLRGRALPTGVPRIEASLRAEPPTEDSVAMTVLDRYIRNGLRRSADPRDHALAEEAVRRLRLLGVQITETGMRASASPVSRVLAYSRAKSAAMVGILARESEVLGERLRAVVVCDYERTSADLGAAADVLDEEAGGAIAAFRAILGNDRTDALNPILVTGSTILVDDDLVDRFTAHAREWLEARGVEVELSVDHAEGFAQVRGSGESWTPRTYVALITAMFQDGTTRCLVGTRGLLGEGWDASRTNVLVDLTTVTTAMSVNQLRGRSIRLDKEWPEKLANNWDVICIADEFARGLADYERFRDRHATWFGVTEDAEIEKGVGHVHAAFTDARPEGIATLRTIINEDMLERAGLRKAARDRWKIGQPFEGVPTEALEARLGMGAGFRTGGHLGARVEWNDVSLTQAIASAVVGALREAKLIQAKAKASVTPRAGGYLRVMLRGGSTQDTALFMRSVREVLGPLDRPRYVIPRYVDQAEQTLVSRLLPKVIGRYFQVYTTRYVMLHAVPDAMDKNKDLAEVFGRHWNIHVGPGEAVYALQGRGESMVADAEQLGMTPTVTPRLTGVFR